MAVRIDQVILRAISYSYYGDKFGVFVFNYILTIGLPPNFLYFIYNGPA